MKADPCSVSKGQGECDYHVGQCLCQEGFHGINCHLKKCPVANNMECSGPDAGKCNSQNGECMCQTGYEGHACEFQKCPGDQTCGNGKCDRSKGLCVCESEAYYGETCSLKKCSGDCMSNVEDPSKSRGECDETTGKCDCKVEYEGNNCELQKCTGDGTCNSVLGNNKCDGTTGKCQCDGDSFHGDQCQFKVCPKFQSASAFSQCGKDEVKPRGTCNALTGLCTCNEPYYGFHCGFTKCPKDCSNRAACDPSTGLCGTCDVGWKGPACESIVCQGDNGVECNGRGICVDGVCQCGDSYYGAKCHLQQCEQNSNCGNNEDPFLSRGSCNPLTGTCVCKVDVKPYFGSHCENIDCENPTCNGHGKCNYAKGECECDSGYRQKEDCKYPLCPLYADEECGGEERGVCNDATRRCSCKEPFKNGPLGACEFTNCVGLNDCNAQVGRGACDESKGACACKDGFYGEMCQFAYCPPNQDNECSGNGSCNRLTGECTCSDDYHGPGCSLRKCPGYDPANTESECGGKARGACNTRSGSCECTAAYHGITCEHTYCPDQSDCGASMSPARGQCNPANGVCVCNSLYYGDRCQFKKCPGGDQIDGENCSLHGDCDKESGVCTCHEGYSKVDCSHKNCNLFNGEECGGKERGACFGGVCQCNHPFVHGSLSSCDEMQCISDCNVNTENPEKGGLAGTCNHSSGKCECNFPFYGIACLKIVCPGRTIKEDDREECFSNGFCQSATGTCECYKNTETQEFLYSGIDCSYKICSKYMGEECGGSTRMKECSQPDGTCVCKDGFTHASLKACDYKICNKWSKNGLECGGPDRSVECVQPTGVCKCKEGFIYGSEEACEHFLCPEYLGHECGGEERSFGCQRETGVCNCKLEYRDGIKKACDYKYCSRYLDKECGGPDRGTCNEPEGGTCSCIEPYYKANDSEACKFKRCGPLGSLNEICTSSDRGECDVVKGECVCKSGYYGSHCQHKVCPGFVGETLRDRNCTGHGECNRATGECACNEEYSGASCDHKICPIYEGSECGEGLSVSRGKCDGQKGVCNCLPGYSGADCGHKNCPLHNGVECGGSSRGECKQPTGECECKEGYSSANCGFTNCPVFKGLPCGGPSRGFCPPPFGGVCTCLGSHYHGELNSCDKKRCPIGLDGTECNSIGTCVQNYDRGDSWCNCKGSNGLMNAFVGDSCSVQRQFHVVGIACQRGKPNLPTSRTDPGPVLVNININREVGDSVYCYYQLAYVDYENIGKCSYVWDIQVRRDNCAGGEYTARRSLRKLDETHFDPDGDKQNLNEGGLSENWV